MLPLECVVENEISPFIYFTKPRLKISKLVVRITFRERKKVGNIKSLKAGTW